MTARLLPALLAALLLSIAVPPAFAQKVEQPDPALIQLVKQAASDNSGFRDKYVAQVWLMTMSQRLAPLIPDDGRRLTLLKMIHEEATRANVSPELVLSVIDVESRFDRFAISRVGAQGLMQIMPFWLKLIGRPDDNLFHVRTNLRMGCTILKYYLDKSHGDIREALQRYNGVTDGINYSDKVLKALSRKWYWD
ncbi:MAG TPA: transglycosylase SLT domain-containing protein [Gammaproteobacteria bacterium]|nr:transglycosylase SLT domain-containing protein [Gammaproteobacteria bacterium]